MNICQKCHTLNPDLAIHCQKCRAALLPPVIPQHLREEVDFLLDDDQLERISSLEFNLKTSRKDLEELVDYLEKQFFNNLHLTITVEKLLRELTRRGVIDSRKIKRQVRRKIRGQLFGFSQRQDLMERLGSVVACYRGDAPKKFRTLMDQAVPFLYTSNHKKGIQLLHLALKLDPDNIPLLRILAEIYFLLGQYSSSRRLLNNVARLAPGDVAAILLNGMILLKMGHYQAARELLERACGSVPSLFSASFLLGVACFLNSDFPGAAQAFRKAYGSNPLPQLSMLSAMAFCLDNSPRKAAIPRRDQAELQETGFFHFLRGLISRQAKQPTRAEQHFQQAIHRDRRWQQVIQKLDPQNPDKSRQLQFRIFISRLHREMEELMGLLISEIQNYPS